MAEYKIPDEYFFRIHQVRPRFKGDIENVLIYMAEEISRIGECETSKICSKDKCSHLQLSGKCAQRVKNNK